jgi:hypothetical protein
VVVDLERQQVYFVEARTDQRWKLGDQLVLMA